MFSGVFYAFRIATFAWSSILTYNFQESHKNLSHNMFSQVFWGLPFPGAWVFGIAFLLRSVGCKEWKLKHGRKPASAKPIYVIPKWTSRCFNFCRTCCSLRMAMQMRWVMAACWRLAAQVQQQKRQWLSWHHDGMEKFVFFSWLGEPKAHLSRYPRKTGSRKCCRRGFAQIQLWCAVP